MRKPYQRLNRKQWVSIMEGQAASSLTVADYCQANDISLASYGKWKRRLREEAAMSPIPEQSPKGFAAVQLIESDDPSIRTATTVSANKSTYSLLSNLP